MISTHFSDDGLTGKLLKQVIDMAQALGPLKIMEVCGTHTMEIGKLGLRAMLPESLDLLSGPGCPVCVTPGPFIDAAAACALRPDATVLTFGDMVRVPGTETSLKAARETGGSVEIVSGPLQAVQLAEHTPEHEFVFIAVGFETTIPAVARAVLETQSKDLKNLSFLVSHRLVPPALKMLVDDPDLPLNAILAPGHASAILGCEPYSVLQEAGIPCAITGFGALDIIAGLHSVLRMLTEGRCEIENMYPRIVRQDGNPEARALIDQVFEPVDAEWRGIGIIPKSGLLLREEFAEYDAEKRYDLQIKSGVDSDAGCRCGSVLRGHIRPDQCPLFGTACTPESPHGPCMVSSEGSCAAYFRYQPH